MDVSVAYKVARGTLDKFPTRANGTPSLVRLTRLAGVPSPPTATSARRDPAACHWLACAVAAARPVMESPALGAVRPSDQHAAGRPWPQPWG
jgi:hypothetical protein